MVCVLGIDSGLTVTKAVVYDADGTQLSVARRRVPQSMPQPHVVERDMDALWSASADAVAEAVAASGRPASDIVAVAATAHGDGVYLLDRDRRPLGPGILSLDSRAGDLVDRWADTDVFDRALAVTGQVPHSSAPSALLAWIKAHQAERFARIAHVLACKDWLRFCLTGTVGTDRTEASTSFTDVRTQRYSSDALAIYGLDDLEGALPPIAGPAEVVGAVTREAAARTGLSERTPVAAGLHDVTASALGIGGHAAGVVTVVAGTYSINEVVSTEPRVDRRWFCRNAIEPGLWNSMSISPASTANYDWFIETLCHHERDEPGVGAASIHERLDEEVGAVLAKPSSVMFHPYLYGSPHGSIASGSFVGLRGWHGRGDLMKALLEGIAFNHRHHVDALRDGFAFEAARLTGGVSRSPTFAQLLADVLAMSVTVVSADETAAFGAALCAGAAVGVYASPHDDPRDLAAVSRTYEPDATRSAAFEERFALFTRIAETMSGVWPDIERMGGAR